MSRSHPIGLCSTIRMGDAEEPIMPVESDNPVQTPAAQSWSAFSRQGRSFDFDLADGAAPQRDFEEYCRALGARSLFDLFHISRAGNPMADSVRAAYAQQLWTALAGFAADNPRELTFPTGLPADLENETTWSLVRRYFGNYSVVASDVYEWFVPVFCAYPTGLPNGRFKVTHSTTRKSGYEFKVGIPGLSGGFGLQRSVSFKRESAEYAVPFQLQVKLSFLVTTWATKRREVKTVSPLEKLASREVTADYRDHFIAYDRSQKLDVLREPYTVLTDGAWITHAIEAGATDRFEIEVPEFGKLAIESETAEQFEVAHYLEPRHEYNWYGLSRSCHDIFVSAKRVVVA